MAALAVARLVTPTAGWLHRLGGVLPAGIGVLMRLRPGVADARMSTGAPPGIDNKTLGGPT